MHELSFYTVSCLTGGLELSEELVGHFGCLLYLYHLYILMMYLEHDTCDVRTQELDDGLYDVTDHGGAAESDL